MDCEFHEYHKQPKVVGIKVGKPIPTIDLISIGIVSEGTKITLKNKGKHVDDVQREYYAICKEFNVKDAWNSWQPKEHSLPMGTVKEYWLRENVLRPIYQGLLRLDGLSLEESQTAVFSLLMFEFYLNKYGKTKKQIAEEIYDFIYQCEYTEHKFVSPEDFKPEFYAYYADYDWVVFCQLFGKMNDLPKGFPQYCKDLKQSLVEAFKIDQEVIDYIEAVKDINKKFPSLEELKYIFNFKAIKEHSEYPVQENEHNALDDAKWDKKLYEFLNTL
jgi:hypothetical protein